MKQFLILAMMALSSMSILAYDFKVDGIYYRIYENEVEVTTGDKRYTGNVIIPDYVTYNNETYRVTSISIQAFYGCDRLTSVVISNNVTSSIGFQTFYSCSKLTSVVIGNGVTNIDKGAFYNCSKLSSVVIGNSVTSIGEAAFGACNCLTSVIIPNSVKTIGEHAFANCYGLKTITFGSNVTSIGDYAFWQVGLKTIYCYAEEPPLIGISTFKADVSNVLLVVPDDAIDKYRTHEEWGKFMLDTITGLDFLSQSSLKGEDIYNLSGQHFIKPQKGINIQSHKKFLVK